MVPGKCGADITGGEGWMDWDIHLGGGFGENHDDHGGVCFFPEKVRRSIENCGNLCV